MNECCICGESVDFQYKPIGRITCTNNGVIKFICKDCEKKEVKDNDES